MEFYYYIRWIVLLYCKLSVTKGLEESSKVHFTNSWAVHIENGNDEIASQIAEKHGFYNFGQIGSLPGYYQFVHKETRKRRKRREVSKTVTLLLEDKIQWVEQQHVLERDKRSIIPDYIDVVHPNGYTIQDPMYNDQWYINNVGQSSGPPGLDINVLPVWSRGISGKGVVVAILDDGLDHTHPDLKANYDAKASYDFNDYDEDPMPRSSDPNNCHGTKCAGEVAAEAGNGVCGVGVAFNSSVGGIRMLDGNVTDTIEGSALSYHKDYIDIYSCAWGPKDDGKRFGRPGTLASKALELGVKEGRNGLGSIFVWATGNGGLTDDDCNCDGYTTSVYTVSIGAISDHGLSTYYTESCASTLAVTYSGGSHREKKENKIVTTTLGHKCTDEFKGTSSAAPLAAGMIALVLESNSNVTWRDIQHIIVETSVMSSPLDEGWRRNGAGKWFNQKFGFGRMDAAAMVEKASTWTNVMEQRNCWSDKSSGPWTIPSSGTLLVAMNTTACAETTSNIKSVEHVQVVVSLQHRRRGHLSIELISPSGTRTQLLKTRRNDRSTKGLKDWVFMSVHFWGEDPKGLWTLAVTDNNNNDREHHLEKNKYGDMEDATGALQDLIEDKEDTTEHEKIVDDDDLFKSAEEFENQIFKDATYRRKGREKAKESENRTEQSDADKEQGKSEQGSTMLKNTDEEKEKEVGKLLSSQENMKSNEVSSGVETAKENNANEKPNRDNKYTSNVQHKESNNDNVSKTKSNSDNGDVNTKAKEEKSSKKETKSKSKETKKEKSKHKEDEKKAAKMKSSEKNKNVKKKSHSKPKSKKKKKMTAEEEAEEKIVEELLKDSKDASLKAPKPKPLRVPVTQSPYPSANQTTTIYSNYQNVPLNGAPLYAPIKPYSYPNPLPYLNVTSNYQAYLPGPIIPPPGFQAALEKRNMSDLGKALSVVPNQANQSPLSQAAPTPATTPLPAMEPTKNISNVTVKTSNVNNTQENNTLENVLRNVLTEVFTNFKQENQGYKLLADRIEGLEMALQDKNKTHAHSAEQTYSSVLLNAFKKGKPIDKIQNVLGVLENQKNLTKHQNSSFSKNAEVVTDVLKVLKDILSTKKDDSELKIYKKRISKLLETSSNSTRQLTEKLFSDIEPTGDAKESSTSVMNDALSLISQIFQRNKPHQSAAKISKDLHVSLKGVAGSNSFNGKPNENVESLTKEQATVSNPQDINDFEPLTNILLHGDFLTNSGGTKDKESPLSDVDKSSEEEMAEKEEKSESVPIKIKASEPSRKSNKDEYEIVGIAEKNGEHIITSPDNGNELGMNKPVPEDFPPAFKGELAGDESRHRHREEESHHPETELQGTHLEGEHHRKLIHIGELQEWHPEGDHTHEEETHQRHHDRELEESRALFHSHEEENGEDTHVGKHDFPSEEGSEESKKDLDDDNGDFTIAIMKGGKKIGERKVNKFTASHYLIKPKFSPDLFREDDTAKPETNDEDVLFKNNIIDYSRGVMKSSPKEHDSPTSEDSEKSIFDYNRGLIKTAQKDHDIPIQEDNEKSSVSEYSKGVTKKTVAKDRDAPATEDTEKSNSNPETPNIQKEADFDVTKFALNENRFSEHTTDHAGKHEAEDVAEDTNPLKEGKSVEEGITRKEAAAALDMKDGKDVKEYNEEKSGERMEKEQKDTRPGNSKRKLEEEESEIKKVKNLEAKKTMKKISSKQKSRKLTSRDHRKYDDEYAEHYVHFNEPLPFMQLPDPSQFAQLPVQADENENFVQPTFDSFNPNTAPNVVNVPDYRDHATYFSENGNGYEVENGRRFGLYDRKRSDIPASPIQLPMQDLQMFPSNDFEEFANEHEGRLLRRRRSVDFDDDEPPMPKQARHDDPLYRVKRDTIEQEDDDDDGPHVVKRSAIITEFFPSENPKAKQNNERRSVIHRSTKRSGSTRKASFSAKRSAVRKATDIINSDRSSKEKTSKESSSVLSIIKRVHDDIALGNSKDLRRLEAELARLEGISMSESNEQVNSFEKLAKERINTVRAKVSKKYREDPDEYYKYGASSSGILESWTLHFYGTGP